MNKTEYDIINDDCVKFLNKYRGTFDLSFLDPPFNQGKEYNNHDDSMPAEEYWKWMEDVCKSIYKHTSDGGVIYFMQREKNAREVLEVLKNAGWHLENVIIWKKKTSAVPQNERYGKHYQIIAFAAKGKPRTFNKLKIDPPRLHNEKIERVNGIYVTDVWDDIRELTSGYFAGDEPLRLSNGDRAHLQQAPIALLLRIILSSTKAGDVVFDPFAGTGTTLVVAKQLNRMGVGVEIDPKNAELIKKRLTSLRKSDDILKFRADYRHTDKLDEIWKVPHGLSTFQMDKQVVLHKESNDV